MVPYVRQLFDRGPNRVVALPRQRHKGVLFERGLSGGWSKASFGRQALTEVWQLLRGQPNSADRCYLPIKGGALASGRGPGYHENPYAFPLLIRGCLPKRAFMTKTAPPAGVQLPVIRQGALTIDHVNALATFTPSSDFCVRQTSGRVLQWANSYLTMRDALDAAGIGFKSGSRGAAGKTTTDLLEIFKRYTDPR
jgi:hypothetical protein